LIGSIAVLLLCASPGAIPLASQEPAKAIRAIIRATSGGARPIEDNSFLIEEAYNQEAGVVQHISTFALQRGTRAWVYAFTQEWPLLKPAAPA